MMEKVSEEEAENVDDDENVSDSFLMFEGF